MRRYGNISATMETTNLMELVLGTKVCLPYTPSTQAA